MKQRHHRLKTAEKAPRAFSLLEMLMAAALVSGTVVPALAVIREAMVQSRDLHHQSLLANYAVQLMEDQASYVATNWTNANLGRRF